MAEKQKLTLSVEKELVEKAKKLGVNISEITENVLRHISETEIKEVVTKEEINAAYEKLFNTMLPAMEKFGASVEVGKVWFDENHSFTVKLLNNGELWIPDIEQTTKIEGVSVDSPKKILSNFIESLVNASEKNKEKLKELEIFRKIIEALTETSVSKK
ncbi:Post-segregation antitoxin CcdA [uncultured archaeon]|nr:Post-segregation antitoxin CcdA [uncultured archaeon]